MTVLKLKVKKTKLKRLVNFFKIEVRLTLPKNE